MNSLEKLFENYPQLGSFIELSIVGTSALIIVGLGISNFYQEIQNGKDWEEKSEERRRAKCIETIQSYITPEAFKEKRKETIETYCQSIFPEKK